MNQTFSWNPAGNNDHNDVDNLGCLFISYNKVPTRLCLFHTVAHYTVYDIPQLTEG